MTGRPRAGPSTTRCPSGRSVRVTRARPPPPSCGNAGAPKRRGTAIGALSSRPCGRPRTPVPRGSLVAAAGACGAVAPAPSARPCGGHPAAAGRTGGHWRRGGGDRSAWPPAALWGDRPGVGGRAVGGPVGGSGDGASWAAYAGCWEASTIKKFLFNTSSADRPVMCAGSLSLPQQRARARLSSRFRWLSRPSHGASQVLTAAASPPPHPCRPSATPPAAGQPPEVERDTDPFSRPRRHTAPRAVGRDGGRGVWAPPPAIWVTRAGWRPPLVGGAGAARNGSRDAAAWVDPPHPLPPTEAGARGPETATAQTPRPPYLTVTSLSGAPSMGVLHTGQSGVTGHSAAHRPAHAS